MQSWMHSYSQDIITLFLNKSDLGKNQGKPWDLLYYPDDEISVQGT